MPDERIPTITLTTDFGTRDGYAAQMKGAILAVNPRVNIVDITHQIPAHDLLEAAFTLAAVYRSFPLRTVHVVVVDPGVGTARRPIIASCLDYYFVAPDNGVLSFMYDREEINQVCALEAEHYRREPVSPTFHGRDIFAPAAAWVTRGVSPDNFGEPVEDYQRIQVPKPKPAGERAVQGVVIHADRFGNLVTNIHADDLGGLEAAAGEGAVIKARIKDQTAALQETYMGGAEGLIALIGSSGYLEIAMPKKSAQKALGANRGEKVALEV
jgi:S-adenosylmethionine hydrolase